MPNKIQINAKSKTKKPINPNTETKNHHHIGALFVVRIRADAPVMQVKKWHKSVPQLPIRIVHNGFPAVFEPLLTTCVPHGELNIKNPKEFNVTAHRHPIMPVSLLGQQGARSVPFQ